MNLQDIGIIISKRNLKENSNIISVFTQNHGICSCVVNNKISYQVGHLISIRWNARLKEHLGRAQIESIRPYSNIIMYSKEKLYALNSLLSIIKLTFKEWEPHNNFFIIMDQYLQQLVSKNTLCFASYIKLELAILSTAGYQLVLDKCSVTKTSDDLAYVSPKSGHAISYTTGTPYADKLLPLPKFLTNNSITVTEITETQKKQAFELTGYFFTRYIFPKEPNARLLFVDYYSRLTNISHYA